MMMKTGAHAYVIMWIRHLAMLMVVDNNNAIMTHDAVYT